MKRTRNYLTAILMIVIGLISLTGCGQKKATAYQSYVKNLLDVNYKGDYTNYIKENKGTQTFTTLATTIYSNAKYEVSESYKENGDYYVDVTIYPIAVLDQSYDEIMSYIEDFNKDVNNGVYNDVKKEEYDKKFANGIASILTSHAENPEYKDAVVVKALINDDGEYYSIASDSLTEIDQAMVATETADATETDTSEE